MRSASQFDPNDPLLRSNPYRIYGRLREQGPCWEFRPGRWLISHYAAARDVLGDSAFRTRADATKSAVSAGVLLMLDGPDHKWLHQLVAGLLAQRIAKSRERIAELANHFAQASALASEMDLIRDLAIPYPVAVICELLGLSPDGIANIRQHSAAVTRLLDPSPQPITVVKALRSGIALFRLADAVVSRAALESQPGLISELLKAREHQPRLTSEMVKAVIATMFVAGHETSTNMIGNGLYALLRHPSELAHIQARPDGMRKAVEELLRYDSPVQFVQRFASRNRHVFDRTIKKGDSLLILIGSANRDPKRFPNPDVLDVTRTDTTHLSFSHGTHACIGAQLGRYEVECAIRAVCEHMPKVQVKGGELSYRPHFAMRGPSALPVKLVAR